MPHSDRVPHTAGAAEESRVPHGALSSVVRAGLQRELCLADDRVCHPTTGYGRRPVPGTRFCGPVLGMDQTDADDMVSFPPLLLQCPLQRHEGV